MLTPGQGDAMAGVYHAQDSNSNLPSHWLVYIIVEM